MSGVHGEDLAHHHPIEEHSQCSQPLFHGRLGVLPELVFDEGRDVDRLDLGQILDAMHSAERGELPDSLLVGAAGVLVADVGAEEVPHPLLCLGLGGEDGGQGSGREGKGQLHSHHSSSTFTHDKGHCSENRLLYSTANVLYPSFFRERIWC